MSEYRRCCALCIPKSLLSEAPCKAVWEPHTPATGILFLCWEGVPEGPSNCSGTCPGAPPSHLELLSPLRSTQRCCSHPNSGEPPQAGWGSPAHASEVFLGSAGGYVLRELRLAGGRPPLPGTPMEKPPAPEQHNGPHCEEERPVPEDAEGGRLGERGAQPAPAALGRGGGDRGGQPGLPDHLPPGQAGGEQRGAAGEGPPDLGDHMAHGR